MASNDQSQGTHQSTYASFMTFTKWGTIFVITVLVALYVFVV
ncbi:aa3-type cytochrome c oxidase subunit IV [Sandarakinorhabdus sp.]